jgi:TRAP transporter 4TM/12TM fusion protein
MTAAHHRPDAASAVAKPAVEEEYGGNKRVLRMWETRLLVGLAIGFTIFHMVILNFYPLEPLLFRAIHVGWGGAIGFMLYTAAHRIRSEGVPWYDWILVAASVACAAYIAVELDGLLFRAGAQFTTGDVICGVVGTLLVLEFARRAAGLALPLIAGIFIIYAFVGPWMPGVLQHKGFGIDRFFTYIYSEYGIFGVTTQVSSTYIILFVTFAAFLTVSKVGDYINDLCNAVFGWARGGPAKAAVASGIMVGSISGSAVANVVASGMVTIPMMRKVGYDKDTAAAIEATSSTGGQITPPVMGAGAFLMAEITGIPYGDIAFAAIMPALLFYIACWIHVDLHAIRLGLRGVSRHELPPLGQMVSLLYMFSPIVVLVWALFGGLSPFRAGALGIGTAMIAGLIAFRLRDIGGSEAAQKRLAALEVGQRLVVRLAAIGILGGLFYFVPATASGFAQAALGEWGTFLVALVAVLILAAAFGWKRTGEGLSGAAKDCTQLVAVCACAGIIVGVIALTGIGGRFSQMLLALAGQSQFIAMMFAALVALILGMGMPTTAAYAIAAAVVAPGVTRMGVPPLVAHMFIFYFAVISAITPPVALASFAAAGMAQSDPWRTSWIALKMGLATFIVPLMFFFSPVLLMQGSWLEIIHAGVTASIGVWFLAAGTEGWARGLLAAPLRAVMIVAALLCMHPGAITDVIGIVLGASVYAYQFLRGRGGRPAPSH